MKKNQSHYQKINPVIRYLMVSTLSIIFITFLISWLLWFFFCRNLIKNILVNFSFINFSVIILTFSAISLIFAFALFLIRKKSIYLNIFSLLSFSLAVAIALTSFFFFIKINYDLLLAIGLPWIIIITATTCLFITSVINLIMISQQPTILITNQNEVNSELKLLSTNKNFTEKNNSNEITNENLLSPVLKEENFNNPLLETSLEETKKKTLEIPLKLENFEQKEKNTNITNNKRKEITKWTKKQIKQVWEKAEIIPGVNKLLYRKDYAGAWMFFSDFINNPNDTDFSINNYSWTIVQHKPLAKEGTNELGNLTPMNIINAMTKGENYPKWKTKISSYGNENIIKEQIWSD